MNWLASLGGSWLIIAAVIAVAVIVIVWLVRKYAKTSNAAFQLIATSLIKAQTLLKEMLPDKWAVVYDSLVEVLKAVIDNDWTDEEAVALAKEAFDKALKFKGVELTDEQKKIVYNVIEWLVSLILHDKSAGAKALAL